MTDPTGALVKRYRLALGLSRAEAAARWDMPIATLDKYEARGIGRSSNALVTELLEGALGGVTAVTGRPPL